MKLSHIVSRMFIFFKSARKNGSRKNISNISKFDISDAVEVKRLEKAYDIFRELYNNTEASLKILDDKSRNNIGAAASLTVLAFVLRKPDVYFNPKAFSEASPDLVVFYFPIVLIILIVIFNVLVYLKHYLITRLRTTTLPSPQYLNEIINETKTPEGVLLASNEEIIRLYHQNLKLLSIKNVSYGDQSI